jgi:hypothetical protein
MRYPNHLILFQGSCSFFNGLRRVTSCLHSATTPRRPYTAVRERRSARLAIRRQIQCLHMSGGVTRTTEKVSVESGCAQTRIALGHSVSVRRKAKRVKLGTSARAKGRDSASHHLKAAAASAALQLPQSHTDSCASAKGLARELRVQYDPGVNVSSCARQPLMRAGDVEGSWL